MRVMFFIFASLLTSCVVRSVDIQPNEIGVVGSGDETLQPGNHFVLFYNELTIYDISEHVINEHIQMLTKDGETVSTELSLYFFPNKASIDTLHNFFGKEYKETFVIPECRASARRILAEITADSLSFLDKSALESLIKKDLSQVLQQRHVTVTRLEVSQILLPADLKAAVKLGLEDAYYRIKIKSVWRDKKVAIDTFLKNNSPEAIRILLRVYEDGDEQTRAYIVNHLQGRTSDK